MLAVERGLETKQRCKGIFYALKFPLQRSFLYKFVSKKILYLQLCSFVIILYKKLNGGCKARKITQTIANQVKNFF
jgi:hypothetical protein